MRNLNAQEKKLFFKIAIILVGLMIVAFSYWGLISMINKYRVKQEKARIELTHKYESRIDSLNTVNYMLAIQTDSLEKEIKLVQGKKEIIYIETIKKDKEIKDASAVEHAKAIDTLTGQEPMWAIVKDSITKDTIINYKFTLPGVIKARLTINNLYKYKGLYQIDEVLIQKQRSEIGIQKTIIANNQVAIDDGKKALETSKISNDKLTKQLNKVQKQAGRWPYWLGAGFVGGITICLLAQ